KTVASDRFLNALSSRYEKGITWALDHTLLVLLATVMMLGLGLLIYSQLGSGFLPTMDEGSFVLDYWMPSGTSLQESDRVVHSIERMLSDTPEVYSFSRRTGAEMGLFATEQSRGDILIRLKRDRSRRVEAVMDNLRDR